MSERKGEGMGLEPRSEKGLLTPENCVVTLIDYQPQMLFGVTSIERQLLISNVVGFAKAARVFQVPVVLTTVETRSFSGEIWPQLQAIFPNVQPVERSSMNSWDDAKFVAAVKAAGKKKIVVGGLWTEVCVAFPAIQELHDGFEVFVVEDLCGDVNLRTHDAAMRRMEQAGAKPVTWMQVMLEWQRDWALTGTYDDVTRILREHGGAYGMGVEYVRTMLHGEKATEYPGWEPKSRK